MRKLLPILALLITLGLTASAAAETVWALEDTGTRRWVDSDAVAAADVTKDARLEVVYREEGWVRVRLPANAGFGWLPDSKVTSIEPMKDLSIPSSLDLGNFGSDLPPINLNL